MKDIRIFGADFERSKRIVTQGDFALTAGMPNPIHMGIINRLFTVIILGFCFSGILIYGVLIGIPEFISVDSDVHIISLEAGLLIHNMSSFLKPFNLTVYVISYLGMVLVFWPKKRLTSQLWTYFPFYFAMSICAFISGLYFASAVAYDAYTWLGFWLELGIGMALFFWIILNSIQNLKRRLNDQEEKSILKQLVRIL
ncbi:beta-carotene 15,15'-monooxygenase, partial [Burkholderia multivorans]